MFFWFHLKSIGVKNECLVALHVSWCNALRNHATVAQVLAKVTSKRSHQTFHSFFSKKEPRERSSQNICNEGKLKNTKETYLPLRNRE